MFEPFVPLPTLANVNAITVAQANVRGILDSYHGEWDCLIELLQNAVDALDLKFNSPGGPTHDERPEIEIVINQKSGTIRVSDNGIGMGMDGAKLALVPNFTDKPYSQTRTGRRTLRGHKGVGLTFLAFGFNLLRYCSKRDGKFISAEISGGRAWVDSEEEREPPRVVPSADFCPEFLTGRLSGSSFEVLVGTEFFIRANANWLGWHYVIRCLTAVGYCDINQLLPWNQRACVTLRIIDVNGAKVVPPDGHTDHLPLEYFYPDNVLKSCNLDEYFARYPQRTETPRSEKGKYEALFVKWDTDKIESTVFDKGQIDDQEGTKYGFYLFTKDHLPSVYAMFTHSQRVWRERLDQGHSNDRRRRFWRPGIQIVTQQMPTGQVQEISLPFRAGNKERVFMLVELLGAKPDYGRKGFKADVNSYIQFLATELINGYFLGNRGLLKPTSVAHGPTTIDAEATADQRTSQAQELAELGVPELCFKKEPQYENDVVALFSELNARDHIRGFDLLSVSSGAQYDAVVNYRFTKAPDKLLHHPGSNPLGIPKARIAKRDLLGKNLEFKKSLVDLLNDFEEEVKSPQKVRFIVTWDEGDMSGSGYEVISLLEGDNHESREFHGQTHLLDLGFTAIPVIMLKHVIKCISGL